MSLHALPFYYVYITSSILLSAGCKIMDDPIVTTKEGTVKGIIGTNIDGEQFYKFFGIPYAKPPVDALRFRPAQPVDPWIGTKDASKVGDACISRDDFTNDIVGSEDCLYMNVYTKNLPNTNSALKPVMVFIHGGGLTLGSSRPGLYGPEFLMLKDIVLVTFNYRLGVLGFLSFDDPALGVPGNLGLKDQNFALKWVQRNIRQFNGNPDNVTIFGNSAGSASVHAHILSRASKGLFQKAIMQSGCALNSWFWGSKNNARELVNNAGKNASTEKEALEILQTLSASDIFTAQEKIYDSPYPADRRPFSAVIEVSNDAEFLSQNPIKTIQDGTYNQVPIMLGYNENEGMLLDFDKIAAEKKGLEIPELNFKDLIPIDLNVSKESNESQAILAILKELYSEEHLNSRYDPMTDSYFLVAIIEALKLHLKKSKYPIFLYRMSLHGELNLYKRLINRTHEPGVCHGDELGYLFRTDITPTIISGSLEDRSVRSFVELWTNFAINGNPTPDKGNLTVTWQPVENRENIQLLDIGEHLKMLDIPERNRLIIWSNILKKWPLSKFS